MYLGFVSILLGAAIFLGSLTVFIMPVVIFFILEKKFIPNEEKILEENFGEEYHNYKKQVRRWL